MEKVQITLPETWLFETVLPVRIGDINYGNHLANDAVLRLAHEVRLQFLTLHHYSEMNVENVGLIMANAVIQFVNQAFYGDELVCKIGLGHIGKTSFDLITQMIRPKDNKEIARIKTGMVCFDYAQQKVQAIPQAFLQLAVSSEQ